MDKYLDKYRIPSARAAWWDYGNNAAYFVTICTQNKIHYFGEIENQTMQLSDLGRAAETCWFEIPNHFPFVKLGAFVVMPNHIHGIIVIEKAIPNPGNHDTRRNHGNNVETQYFASLQNIASLPNANTKNRFGPQSQNLASIIRGFKIGVTKLSKSLCPDFQWQSRFHDHIIRNDTVYQRIINYIETNPINWEKDEFFKSEKI